MIYESCINIINFQQSIQKLCKSKAKTLEKDIFSLKFKILTLIFTAKTISPTKIKEELSLAKSNVAMFCKTLLNEGKIESVEDKKDHRAIYYNLTKTGEKYVSSRLREFSKVFEGQYSVSSLLKIEKNINNLCESLKIKKGE